MKNPGADAPGFFIAFEVRREPWRDYLHTLIIAINRSRAPNFGDACHFNYRR
jgi:hypothetical protein